MDEQQDQQVENSSVENAPVDNNQNPTSELELVRKAALQALAPILGEVKNMNPERKFELSMSAMRFTDNKAIAPHVLNAALEITDPESKAEALIELITELNYLENA